MRFVREKLLACAGLVMAFEKDNVWGLVLAVNARTIVK